MKTKRSALARKGEAVRRKVHGDAHVDRGYAEADALMLGRGPVGEGQR